MVSTTQNPHQNLKTTIFNAIGLFILAILMTTCVEHQTCRQHIYINQSDHKILLHPLGHWTYQYSDSTTLLPGETFEFSYCEKGRACGPQEIRLSEIEVTYNDTLTVVHRYGQPNPFSKNLTNLDSYTFDELKKDKKGYVVHDKLRYTFTNSDFNEALTID